MAEQVVDKRVPTLMAATMIGTQMNAGKGPKEQMKLKLRMRKLKESIVREATTREAQMHDREERLALAAALRALEDVAAESGDDGAGASAARAILSERLRHVDRRMAQARLERTRGAFDSSSSEDEDDRAEAPDGDGPHAASPLEGASDASARLLSDAYWADIGGEPAPGSTEAGSLPAPALSDPEAIASLHARGFLCVDRFLPEPLAAGALARMRAVAEHGWPPVFAFAYDESWALVRGVWDAAETLLGGPAVLEPSFAGFHLNYAKAMRKEKYVGTNFALPHRDYTYSDSVFSDGTPKILSVWIPLNAVNTENGCMYVVPREFDGNFDKDGAYEHLQVLTEGGLKGQQFLHFPLDGIQPLPGGPGSLMCWYGNCIHWGSACHSTGKHDPRASIALVFRRADAFHGFDSPCLRRSDVERTSTRRRLELIGDAMAYFQHWYSVPAHLSSLIKGALSSGKENAV